MAVEDCLPPAEKPSADTGIPAGLPSSALVRPLRMPTGETVELLIVPGIETDGDSDGIKLHAHDSVAAIMVAWVAAVSPSPVIVPLYGCLAVQGTSRAGILGPADRLDQLQLAVTEFSARESDLRDIERRSLALFEAAEADAAARDAKLLDRRPGLAARYLETVSLGRRLALLAPAVHAPAIHPPTLASQLGERLRERTRLTERHEMAGERVECIERVVDSCRQRALELGVARMHTGLEWALVILLVAQTVLLVVDLLSRQGLQ